ncbi:type VI secretion protein IcmF, partial [Vibrio parahaemolyticus EKP-028]
PLALVPSIALAST